MVGLLVQRLVAFGLILEELGQKLAAFAEKEFLLGQKPEEVGQKLVALGEMG